MNVPKVSVILPVYNVEQYLSTCLESLVNQTLKDIEIICVDDGSTDGSLEIINRYSSMDDRVIVVVQENAGAGAARNHGMKYARGEYLSFLDSDDFFEHTMLEKAYIKAKETECNFVVYHSDMYFSDDDKFEKTNWVVRDQHIPPYDTFSCRQVTTNIFKVFVGWAWDKLYDRKFVESNNLYFQEQRTTNDMLFVFSALFLAKSIAVVPDILAHHRRDYKDSLSQTREKSWGCFFNALVALRSRLIEEKRYTELEKDFINYALHSCLWNYNTLAEPTKSMLKEKLNAESRISVRARDPGSIPAQCGAWAL